MNEQFELGDIVRLRKKHPCGSYDWIIMRLGVDIGIACRGCSRRVLMPRSTFVRKVQMIVNDSSENGGSGSKS